MHAGSMDSVEDMNAFAKRRGAMTLRTATGERTLTLAEARALSRAREEQAQVRPPCQKTLNPSLSKNSGQPTEQLTTHKLRETGNVRMQVCERM